MGLCPRSVRHLSKEMGTGLAKSDKWLGCWAGRLLYARHRHGASEINGTRMTYVVGADRRMFIYLRLNLCDLSELSAFYFQKGTAGVGQLVVRVQHY